MQAAFPSRHASRWTWLREPGPVTLGNGVLRLATSPGDLHEDSDDAPVLWQPAPEGDFVVEAAVRLGDTDRARRFLPGLADWATHTTSPVASALLLRCQALEHRPWPTLARGPRRVTLEALPTAPADEVKKALNMVAAGPGAAEGVYLTRLLCIP